MKLEPLFENVIIERLKEKNTSEGGIILPDVAKRESQIGKIVAVGEGKPLETLSGSAMRKMSVKKDDIVCFSAYSGTEIEIENKKYVIMPESNILAVIK